MSIASLIDSYGRTMTRTRQAWTRDITGGPVLTAAGSTAAVTGYLQAGGGGPALRYGRQNVQYSAVAYFLGGTDVKEHDTLSVTISGVARTYDVLSVVVPDDRATTDHMCHMVVGLQEELPRA